MAGEPPARPHVLLGVSGSVAAVKFAQLAVKLSEFAELCVVTTGPAQHFCDLAASYDPEAFAEFEALGIPVYTDKDEWEGYRVVKSDPVLHVELHKWADVVCVAPCSANTLGKIANGLADNLLTCVARVYSPDTPVVIAPAMNTGMWLHPVTDTHLAAVQGYGFEVVPPGSKELACGDVGVGALAEVDTIVATVRARLVPGSGPSGPPVRANPGAVGAGAAGAGSAAVPPPASVLPPPAPGPAQTPHPAAPPAGAGYAYATPGGYGGHGYPAATPAAAAYYGGQTPMAPAPAVAPAPAPSTNLAASLIDTKGLAETLARLQALNQTAAETESELAQARANAAAVSAATGVLPPHMAGEARLAQEFAAKQLAEAEQRKKDLEKAQAEAFLRVAQEQVRITSGDPSSAGSAALQKRLGRYSMKAEAARRRRQRARQGLELAPVDPGRAFSESRLITGDDRVTLLTLLPLDRSGYDGPAHAKTRLVFATWNNYPATLSGFSREFPTSPDLGPTVVLVKSGDQLFGGYAADAWDFNNLFGGRATSFLFSITKDCKLPYHGRVKGPKQDGDPEEAAPANTFGGMGGMGGMGAGGAGAGGDGFGGMSGDIGGGDGGFGSDPYGGMSGDIGGGGMDGTGGFGADPMMTPAYVAPRNDCLKSSNDSLQFGLKDLVIKGDFTECSSELENSYGIGLKLGSADAKTLLAGAPVFKADAVEIWAVGEASSGFGGGDFGGGDAEGGDDYGDGGEYGETDY